MTFKINDVEAEVSPLTINSLKELASLLYDSKGNFVGIEKLFEKVNDFMKKVVFRGNKDVKDVDFGEIPYDQFDDIVAFFLEKNPKAKQRLLELTKTLGINPTALMDGL